MTTATPGAPVSRRRWPSVRALSGLRPADLVALSHVGATLVFVEVAVRTVPLERLVGWLGVTLQLSPGPTPAPPGAPRSGATWRRELREVRLARKAARYWPFGAGPCLRESLVLGHILRRHHPVLRLGVARDGGAVLAHAWLAIDGVSLEAERGFLPFGE